MFPTHVRFTGFAISYNVATAAFGGTAPLRQRVADRQRPASNLVPAFYMMASCVVGMIALAFVVETKGASLDGRGVPGVINRDLPGRSRPHA